MTKFKKYLGAIVVATVVMALILPSSAVVTNEVNLTGRIQDKVKEYRKILPIEGSKRADNIQLPTGDGDNRIPSITMDDQGRTVVTWTNEEDINTWNLAVAYSDDPTDPMSWATWIIALDSTEMIYHSDTAFVTGDFNALYGVNLYWDTEQPGGYEILDVTQDPGDTDYWTYYYWDQDAGDPICRAVEDAGLYEEPYHHPDSPGAVSMAIFHWTDMGYDIPGCPIYFNQDIAGDSTTFFFDAQANLWSAPARDCDLATTLPDWFHLTWEYHNETTDTDQIVWKKIDPAVEADIEFVPSDWQEYRAEGTNPSIEAYEDGSVIHLAIVYVNNGQVKCVYSNDDGENWLGPVTVANGVYPALRVIGKTLYCAFIDDNDIYVVSSIDGGATWSAPSERINDEEGSVEEEENAVDIHIGGIVWVDDREGDLKIYWAELDIGGGAPPGAPDIDGPKKGDPEKTLTYTFKAIDPDGDEVKYIINWGDGTPDTVTGLNPSGVAVTETHSWSSSGKYNIRAKAEDSTGLPGPERSFEVVIPRNRARFLSIFDIFPNLVRLFNILFG